MHMRDGATVEVGLIGRDGMVGIPVLLGDDIAFEAAVVQIAGDALRNRELRRPPRLSGHFGDRRTRTRARARRDAASVCRGSLSI
jgi:hypothetical protein